MQIRFGQYYLIDSAALLQMEARLMSAISDKLNAAIDKESASFDAALARVNADLTNLRSTIDDLKAQQANGNLSADEETALETRIAALGAKADAMDALVNTPPVPPATPTPAPTDPNAPPATDPNATPAS